MPTHLGLFDPEMGDETVSSTEITCSNSSAILGWMRLPPVALIFGVGHAKRLSEHS